MDVRVQGTVAPDPFLSAAALLETEYELAKPVTVQLRENPDERTWAAHYEDHHVLNISRQAATSVMARELALHEFAHMARYEQHHASHTQSTEEALFLALAGTSVERRKLSHCYQIANHMKDIYADDITLNLAPATKLIDFFAAKLAAAIADRPTEDDRPALGSKPPVRTRKSRQSTLRSLSDWSNATDWSTTATDCTNWPTRPLQTHRRSTSHRLKTDLNHWGLTPPKASIEKRWST